MSEDKIDKIIELLQEILKWTKIEGKKKVRTVIDSELDDDTKKLIYHLSDGKSSSEIVKFVDVTGRTVRRYWKKWAKKGIMGIHPDYKRRYQKLFSLEEVGIEPPEVEEDQDSDDYQ
jgi:Fic family protein